MKLTCTQMDILISFYMDNELSPALKSQVEEHLQTCNTCKRKYELIATVFNDIKDTLEYNCKPQFTNSDKNNDWKTSVQYSNFKKNLSAYIDNELPADENLKIRKFAISNKTARKELENTYRIRKLMNNSFEKTKSEVKNDFAKSIIRQLELDEETALNFHPAIKLLIAFTISIITLSTIILLSLNV